MNYLSNDTILKALKKLRPTASFSINGETLEGIDWISQDVSKPSESEILIEAEKVYKEMQTVEYKAQQELDILKGILPDYIEMIMEANNTDFPEGSKEKEISLRKRQLRKIIKGTENAF